ncbi:Hypothetical predicted protein [Cloeon dipterum]|uniref:Uncharacterized protein n=1 Tax=Cloeon dipterum TaxID=197152 RepID=A0A8S1D954_9INSE|nr:Hypothetical predicted protein [Cloeon dipterum]
MPARRPELPVVGVDSTTPFRRQRPVKRRCRPRPGNNGGGVEAAAAAVELGRVMRVEQTRVMSPDSCWQEQPRKVPRSSSRSLGEALSTLLYQPYECRDDSSSSSDEEQMIMTEDGKRPADGASVVEEPPASSGRGGVQEEAEEKWQAVSVSSEASAGADAAVSPVAPRMVSVSVEAGPPAASSAAPAVAAPEELETEDEERRLCSVPHVSSVQIVACERTFTSSEAQTDLDSREQRRRQRRERRQQRLLSRAHPAPAPRPCRRRRRAPMDRLLPDLLVNSYLQQPPPYSTLPIRTIAGPPPPPPQGLLLPAAALGSPPPPPLVHQPLAMRLSFPITPSSRR